ncbi:MAG: bifunctional folylpolyglutamate synthase/dihydrofolate synthase [Cyanobacteria bacterium Co-bin8]|nr:bifunctional folylpolyglutamate synthase/dihydrofolate synthase [Cyanobacteria bacterium Co-bin8]
MNAGSTVEPAFATLLARYERFGVDLGLERIEGLLMALGHPHTQVPIVHVAGTNGKGSVCAYLSSILAQAGYRVGRYTSPHLVSWCERICINEQPISADDLLAVLQQVEAAIDPEQPCPTQFEVITAAAWLYFARQAVDIAVVEVGLGGRLDATNVCDRPLVTLITSLSREHWQRLGPTLADIAREKAGILKPGCPAVVGPLPTEAAAVVQKKIADLGCPAIWPTPAQLLESGWAEFSGTQTAEAGLAAPELRPLQYPLPFLGPHQLTNSALAIATLQLLQDQGWNISDEAIVSGMAQARWPGRLQWVTWPDSQGNLHKLLIDGAHNPAAAKALRAYVDQVLPGLKKDESNGQPPAVTWLMGMLSTKDHADIFRELLRPGDRLHLVPVPGHSTAAPEELSAIATAICPDLAGCQIYDDLAEGLVAIAQNQSALTVLCGSLYLVGHFFATQQPASIK